MRENALRLAEFLAEPDLGDDERGRMSVLVARSGPAYSVYRVDDWISCGVFGTTKASNAPQRECGVKGGIGELLRRPFEDMLTSPECLALPDYLELQVSVPGDGGECRVRYVDVDDQVWINLQGIERAMHRPGNLIHVDNGRCQGDLADRGRTT